nr:LptA/OstA family protein [Halanaerobacter jeridensis]
MEADDVQYFKKDNFIIAEGNAHLKTDEINLWADKMEIDMTKKTLKATGNVRVKDGQGEVESDEFEYNLKLASGLFIDAQSTITDKSINGELYLNTPKIDYGEDKSELDKVKSTSCDYDVPHYKITSSSIVVYPGDKIIAYNNFIWEFNGTIPILYSPILIYSLKNESQILEHQVGHSETRGWFLKNTYNYFLDENYDNNFLNRLAGDQGQLYFDYFQRTGLALGFKHYFSYREDNHSYLYLYTEEDKLNPSYSPWVTVELDSYLRRHNITRNYNLEYKDHESNYWTNPEKETNIDFDFSQNNQFQDWDSELDFDYDKSSSYEHKTDFDLNFEGEITDNQELELDLEHRFEQNSSSYYYSNEIERNYEGQLKYDWQLSEEHYNDDLELDLGYFYDDNDRIPKEYDLDFAVKKHFTEEHYIDYEYIYDDPLDRGVIEDNYLEEIDDEKTGHLHSLILGKDKGRSFYDWELTTKLFQQDSDIGYYYLPEAEMTLYPGEIWDNQYLNNLDVSLGGANKYASSWGHKEQNGYYKLDYYDVISAPLQNSIILDQQFQQDYYSTGQSRWFHESRLVLNTKIFENWNNKITHNYDYGTGEAPDRFIQKNEEHTIDERLEWRDDDSRFYVETGYDVLDEEYELLKSELNLEFKEHYEWDTVLAYDLNEQLFEKTVTSLEVEYNNLEYETAAEFDLNESKMIQWDNGLDWKFGPQEWRWHLLLNNSYDFEDEEMDKAEISLEKRLHCRRVSLAYDYSSEEIWFQYEILAFPQGRVKFGTNEEEGMLFDDDLGGMLDDLEEE